jgi:tetratricopeptide (TPR) repeat protein
VHHHRIARPRARRVRQAAIAAAAVLVALLSACSGASNGAANAKPATLLAAGIAAERQGNANAARQLFQQVLDKDSGNVFAHYNLGVLAQQRKDIQTALTEYGKALASNPNYVPALYNQATIYATTDASLAMATYRQVIQLQPHAPTAYLNLGLLEAAAGLHGKAVADLTKALRQDPTLAQGIPHKLLADVGGATTSSSPTPTP